MIKEKHTSKSEAEKVQTNILRIFQVGALVYN